MAIDAFEEFQQKYTEFEYHIYGRGSQERLLKDYIQSKGLDNRVKIMGYANNVHEKMKDSMIFISSSDYEGISNAILEAMAIGIPVICTDCPIGGNRMLIKNGVNGFLICIGDAHSLTNRIAELVDDIEMRKRFSVNASKVRIKYSTENIMRYWVEVVRGL